MSSEILISSDPWENRVAILEDGNLAELYIEREEKVIGSIYKGKVQNVLPGMGAAFVDIGLGRNAFLYVDDINKQPLNIGDVEITQGHSGFTIGEKVKRGDDILVQIVKEPRGLKGARISTNISLPGRYLILMPAGKYSGVSRKIDSAQERDRLKSVMKRIRPEGMATVVRTAAAGASEAELIADLGVLIRMWHGILETYKRAPAPSLLHKDMNLIYKAARDFITADVDRVLIDDEEEYRKVRDFLHLLGPQFLDRVQHYERGDALFEDFHINDELQKLMRPKINLPSGGSIVIESTEALTVIDVNSGKFTGGRNLEDTIVRTNLEAAAEIARQVRLRDIGGIIVVDFIDMASDAARAKVVKSLEDGLRRDRTRATIQSFSNLGLLEFTRKRIGKDLGSQLRGTCPTCSGMGSVMSSQSVAIETFRHIRHATDADGGGEIVAHVAPTVAMQMDFWYEDECKELAHELSRPVVVRVDPMLHPEKSRIDAVDPDKRRNGAVRVGDEHEVELLPGRLPNATSAAAVVGDRIVEVENAANNAGNTARIRILDVDDEDDYVLAEAVTAAAATTRRRRRGRAGKEPATAAQQAKQLRELAEEAANQAQSRPPIGISTATEEEEAQDKTLIAERRGEDQADAIVIGEGDGEGRHKRRRRRRGRGGRGRGGDVVAAAGVPPATAAGAPAQSPAVERAVAAKPAAASESNADGGDAETARRSRRRRHRRRGREPRAAGFAENGSAANVAPLTGSLPESPESEPAPSIPRLRRAQPPAISPGPNLPVAVAPPEEPQKARPVRRRRAAVPAATVAEAPAAEATDAATKPKRVRKPAATPGTGKVVAAKAKTSAAKRKKTPPAKKPAARKKAGPATKRRSPG